LLKSIVNAVSESMRPRVETRALPIFPLNTVLFPGGVLSLKIFETRYMDMAKAALKHNTPFGIALILEGSEVGTPAAHERIGTAVNIAEWDMQQLGVLQVRVRGEKRFRIQNYETTNAGLIVAQVEMIDDDVSSNHSTALQVCAAFLQTVIAQIGSQIPVSEHRFGDSFWVGARLAEILPLGNTIKQKMLELTDPTIRLELLLRFLQTQGLVARP
jgi:uncharacterized protein